MLTGTGGGLNQVQLVPATPEQKRDLRQFFSDAAISSVREIKYAPNLEPLRRAMMENRIIEDPFRVLISSVLRHGCVFVDSEIGSGASKVALAARGCSDRGGMSPMAMTVEFVQRAAGITFMASISSAGVFTMTEGDTPAVGTMFSGTEAETDEARVFQVAAVDKDVTPNTFAVAGRQPGQTREMLCTIPSSLVRSVARKLHEFNISTRLACAFNDRFEREGVNVRFVAPITYMVVDCSRVENYIPPSLPNLAKYKRLWQTHVDSLGFAVLALYERVGQTLGDFIAENHDAIDWQRLQGAYAHALGAMHGSGIFHLDLHNSNICVQIGASPSNFVLNVIDFGTALDTTQPGAPDMSVIESDLRLYRRGQRGLVAQAISYMFGSAHGRDQHIDRVAVSGLTRRQCAAMFDFNSMLEVVEDFGRTHLRDAEIEQFQHTYGGYFAFKGDDNISFLDLYIPYDEQIHEYNKRNIYHRYNAFMRTYPPVRMHPPGSCTPVPLSDLYGDDLEDVAPQAISRKHTLRVSGSAAAGPAGASGSGDGDGGRSISRRLDYGLVRLLASPFVELTAFVAHKDRGAAIASLPELGPEHWFRAVRLMDSYCFRAAIATSPLELVPTVAHLVLGAPAEGASERPFERELRALMLEEEAHMANVFDIRREYLAHHSQNRGRDGVAMLGDEALRAAVLDDSKVALPQYELLHLQAATTKALIVRGELKCVSRPGSLLDGSAVAVTFEFVSNRCMCYCF
jgi:hypothetical protein